MIMSTIPCSPEEAEAEANKYVERAKEAQQRGLADFLDWLRERYMFGDRDGEECFACGAGATTHDSGEKILAAYFEIDLDKVEQHRRRLLDEMRAKSA